jgi:NADPH-dependent glutamate synthase beta subunit-like oxidoreductase
MGLPQSVGIDNKAQDIDGLYSAMEFLSVAKQPGTLDIEGKRVAAIGGGNTAMDIAVTAAQLGASDVYVIYRRSFKEMPAWDADRNRAMNEGVHFLILTQPLGYNNDKGKLKSITVCPTRLGEPDASGRRSPENVETSAYELDMDIVVEAIGQQSPEHIGKILPGVELAKGLIKTKQGTSRTVRQGVFAGGDLVRGASTVVAAVSDGMKAAVEIDEYLKR